MGDTLSLAQAAKLAGVTAVTMKKWADKIPDVERTQRGEYRIPREALMGYLAHKDTPPKVTPKLRGAYGGHTPHNAEDLSAYLQGQLAAKDRMIDELRAELKEAQGEVRKLEAEMRAHLQGVTTITGALSRWITSKTK